MSSWRNIAILVVVAVVLAMAVVQFPRTGHYWLRDGDHADIMTSATTAPSRTLRILFVGNSLTFIHDIPAMLVNIASSDRENTTRFEVKAITRGGVDLSYMLTQTDALAWAQANHPDYVVLQEHSLWYGEDMEVARRNIESWKAALKPLGASPVLFEVWADGDGSLVYTDRGYAAFGLTPAQDARRAAAKTSALAEEFGLSKVPVGEAFERAREAQSTVPDVYGPDRHHASAAGAYLAALVFYNYFTGLTGRGSAYRPWGLGADDMAKLVQLSAPSQH